MDLAKAPKCHSCRSLTNAGYLCSVCLIEERVSEKWAFLAMLVKLSGIKGKKIGTYMAKKPVIFCDICGVDPKLPNFLIFGKITICNNCKKKWKKKNV